MVELNLATHWGIIWRLPTFLTYSNSEESANFRPLALKIFKEIEDNGNVQDAVEMH